MGLILDTSVIIKLEREGVSETFNPRFDRDQIAISVVTVSELLAEVHQSRGEQSVYRSSFVEELLDRLEPLPITPRIARIHADMASFMKQEGRTIGSHDQWIAATALAHGATVVTMNRKDFEKVPALQVVSPND
ncbi:MAG: DUF4411 family protein [Solirubrobacterales bacterium]|nr:DUF4411 family protein [Solirubrobacterales bacterium]